MKRKKTILTALFLAVIGLGSLHAQETTITAGGEATGSGGTVSYSIGQVADNANTGSNGSEIQGVQQPYEFLTVGIDRNTNISLSIYTYPNPAVSSLNLKVEQDFENLSFRLYDMNGRLLLSKKISSAITSIPMETLANATYLLKVTGSKDEEIKSFQIIKNK